MTARYFLVEIAIDGGAGAARLKTEQANVAAVLRQQVTHPALRIPQAFTTLLRPYVAMPIHLVSEHLSTA